MRILAFSDTHGDLPDLDGFLTGVDMVLIAGDICLFPGFSSLYDSDNLKLRQKDWLETDFRAWSEKIKLPIYLTLGNHDVVEDFETASNVQVGTARVVDNILLYSWVLPLFGARAVAEEEIKNRLKTLLRNSEPQIWLTHSPPYGVCDETDGALGSNHAGSRALRKAIEKYQPNLVVCGHIHEGGGQGFLGKTMIYNVSLLNSVFEEIRLPVIIDLPD